MERIRKIIYRDKEILIVDYSDCKGEELIGVFEEAKKLVLQERKRFLVLSILNNKTYLSPGFVRHIEKEIWQAEEFIARQAVIGLSQVQEWILMGINLWYKRQIHAYDTKDKALEFLVKDNANIAQDK